MKYNDAFELTIEDTVFTELVDFEVENGIYRDEDSYKTCPIDAELWQCVERLNDLMAKCKAWRIENR